AGAAQAPADAISAPAINRNFNDLPMVPPGLRMRPTAGPARTEARCEPWAVRAVDGASRGRCEQPRRFLPTGPGRQPSGCRVVDWRPQHLPIAQEHGRGSGSSVRTGWAARHRSAPAADAVRARALGPGRGTYG